LFLGILDTSQGYFEVEIKEDDKGNMITYNDLLLLDAHLKISGQLFSFQTQLVVDLGVNELTGTKEQYDLFPVEDQNASGTIQIFERKSGESKLRITYPDGPRNDLHPVNLYSESFEDSGSLVLNLNPIDPANGFSDSHVSELLNGSEIKYEQLVNFDGHIRIHLSPSALSIVLAAGEIGPGIN
jgi:hypothetical protein